MYMMGTCSSEVWIRSLGVHDLGTLTPLSIWHCCRNALEMRFDNWNDLAIEV